MAYLGAHINLLLQESNSSPDLVLFIEDNAKKPCDDLVNKNRREAGLTRKHRSEVFKPSEVGNGSTKKSRWEKLVDGTVPVGATSGSHNATWSDGMEGDDESQQALSTISKNHGKLLPNKAGGADSGRPGCDGGRYALMKRASSEPSLMKPIRMQSPEKRKDALSILLPGGIRTNNDHQLMRSGKQKRGPRKYLVPSKAAASSEGKERRTMYSHHSSLDDIFAENDDTLMKPRRPLPSPYGNQQKSSSLQASQSGDDLIDSMLSSDEDSVDMSSGRRGPRLPIDIKPPDLHLMDNNDRNKGGNTQGRRPSTDTCRWAKTSSVTDMDTMISKPRRNRGMPVSHSVLGCINKKNSSDRLNDGFSNSCIDFSRTGGSNRPKTSGNASWDIPGHNHQNGKNNAAGGNSKNVFMSSSSNQLIHDMLVGPTKKNSNAATSGTAKAKLSTGIQTALLQDMMRKSPSLNGSTNHSSMKANPLLASSLRGHHAAQQPQVNLFLQTATSRKPSSRNGSNARLQNMMMSSSLGDMALGGNLMTLSRNNKHTSSSGLSAGAKAALLKDMGLMRTSLTTSR